MKEVVATGSPTFRLDKNGFPLVGEVIRYYRQHMTYTNTAGITRHWTQPELAKRLHVSEITVRLMETKHRGLDSIERRRTLAVLLSIPPALLGLASVDDVSKAMQKDVDPVSPSKTNVNESEVQLYKDALHVFSDKYDVGGLNLQTMETWLSRVNGSIPQIHGKLKNDLLAILAQYHLLAANAYSHDARNWDKATEHLNVAKDIANLLNDTELFAMSCYYTSNMHFCQHNILSATKELDAVLSLSKPINQQLRGNALVDIALARAITGADEADRLYVRKALDDAEKYTTDKIDGKTLMSFNNVQYLETRADTLKSIKRYGLALECIDDAEEYLTNKTRNREFLKILRAECYIKQRKTEYEEAVKLLTQVLDNNKSIQYYVDYVGRLHKLVKASSYGNAPDVIDLGMALRDLRIK